MGGRTDGVSERVGESVLRFLVSLDLYVFGHVVFVPVLVLVLVLALNSVRTECLRVKTC